MPTLEARHDVIRLIREWNADAVGGRRPNHNHPDPRYGGRVVQDAAYMVQVPNVLPTVKPTDGTSIVVYFQDRFQKPYPFEHDITVAIDDVIDPRMGALEARESKFYEWLPWVSDALDALPENEIARKEWLEKQWTGGLSEAVRTS